MIIFMNVLITGITGQDGIFLLQKLLNEYKNLNIFGISRSYKTSDFLNMISTGNLLDSQKINLINLDLNRYEYVYKFLKDFQPNLVFNLSGPSSVYESIKFPNYENEIINIFNNLIEALIKTNNYCKFFQASTSEMFGLNNEEIVYDEKSKFLPNSPYARGKLHNHLKISELRTQFEWDIYSGIMFNHESEYRKENYLFMKLINSAIQIQKKKSKSFTIGSLEVTRDWSYAGDIAKGIFSITQNGKSFDYVLGSGVETKIKNIVDIIFTTFNLNYEKYININPKILRENDPIRMVANPIKINKEIGWKTETSVEKMIEKIVKSKLNN